MERLRGKIKRECYIKDHVCHIPLADGREAVCDEDRMPEVKNSNWHANTDGYAVARVTGALNSNKSIYLHRLLYPELKMIDHCDGNKLDNRSCNLRECTKSQNTINAKLQRNNTSGYKGVSFHKPRNKWTARLMFNRKTIYLGLFADPKEAALAYNKKAVELFGEFAKLNIVEGKI